MNRLDAPSSNFDPRPSTITTLLDRWFWLAILLTALIVIPRSLSIAHAHSESCDDQWHLIGGLARLTGEPLPRGYNDPPLGQMLIAMPLYASGCTLAATGRDPLVTATNTDPRVAILYGQRLAPETLLMLVAGWKAILFLPGAAVVFQWCRRLYGLRSAWLGLAAVVLDPTVAAHVPVAALDVLGVEAILVACYLSWRCFESPNWIRLSGASAAVAAAMVIKQAAIVLPVVVLAYAALHFWKRRREGRADRITPSIRSTLAAGVLLVPLFIWIFVLFDVSRPLDSCLPLNATYGQRFSLAGDVVNPNLSLRWPAGVYIASVVEAMNRNSWGHASYLFGSTSSRGWWYYQLAVGLFKVPIPLAIVLLIGAISFLRRRMQFAEWSLLLPALCCAALLTTMHINIGFRHALPVYVLFLMLASRSMTCFGRPWRWIAGCCVALAGVHGLIWHPDELCYINLPWKRPHLYVSDSNVDWGQSLKQIRRWLDENPQPAGKPVYLVQDPMWGSHVSVSYYLGDRVHVLEGDPPAHGLLILSPTYEAGVYTSKERFAAQRRSEPIAIIGHCARVYDLDQRTK